MTDGAFRRAIRRLIPHKLRWLARAAWKRTTGLYYRDIIRRLDVLAAETQGEDEIMDLVLRRLRTLEDAVAQPLSALEEQVAGLAQPLSALEEQVARQNALLEPVPNELSARTVGLLNFEKSHMGFRARFGHWTNDPVNVEYTPHDVRWTFTNERIVEIPFTFQALSTLTPPARILDIGAQESLISLHLASLGYRVTAIDIRPYQFAHPNLTFLNTSILNWEGDGRPYDAAILLSTLEHLGLPVYEQTNLEVDADEKAMAKVRTLLRPGSILVLTVPFGPSHIEETQRIYSAADLRRHLQGFVVQQCCMTIRLDKKTWILDRDVQFGSLSEVENTDERERVILIAARRE